MRDGLTIQLLWKLGIGEGREGLCNLSVGDALVIDDEPLEERLVPLAAQVARRSQVGPLAVGEQVERLVEGVSDAAEGCLGGFQVTLGLPGLRSEPVLLGAQEVDRHRARVIGVEELLAFLVQLGEAAALVGGLGLGLLAHPAQRNIELLPNKLGLAELDGDVAVGVLHRRLDQIDWHVGLLTAGSLHPPDAEEVGVLTSIPFRLDQAHPRTASTAVERALQVVVMLSILLGGVVVGGEDGLGFGEGHTIDQMLMPTLVLSPGVAHGAYVVGVLEHGRELRA